MVDRAEDANSFEPMAAHSAPIETDSTSALGDEVVCRSQAQH